MSLRRSPTAPTAAAARTARTARTAPAAPAGEALVKQAIVAHIRNIHRRLAKQPPISQINPWMATYRNEVLKGLKNGGGGGGRGGGGGGGGIAPSDPAIETLKKEIKLLKDQFGRGMKGMSEKRIKERNQFQEEMKELKDKLLARLNQLDTRMEEMSQEQREEMYEFKEEMKELNETLWKAEFEELRQYLSRLQNQPEYQEFEEYPRAQQAQPTSSTTGSTAIPTDRAQLNPWPAKYRLKLREAQQPAVRDDENLREELEKYRLTIEDLRDKLSKSREDGDAQRWAQIDTLQKSLDRERAEVQVLTHELDDHKTNDYQAQLAAAQAYLSESQGSLKQTNQQLLQEMKSRRETLEAEALLLKRYSSDKERAGMKGMVYGV